MTLNIFFEKCEKRLINKASDIPPVHAQEDTSKCRQKYRMLKEQTEGSVGTIPYCFMPGMYPNTIADPLLGNFLYSRVKSL